MPSSRPVVGGLPHRQPLTAATWRAAAVVAGLRLASNDMSRTRRRDQGASGNVRNDIMGVLAELVGRHVLETRVASGPVGGVLLDPDGAVDDVDAAFADRASTGHRVELKGCLRQPNYRLFAINDEAHRRSAARGSTGFVGLLFAPGGPEAVVSSVVPLADVERWKIAPSLNKARNDPARVLPLAAFRARYTRGTDVDPDARPLVSWRVLEADAAAARARLAEVRAEAPAALLGTAAQARDWAVDALERWR